MGKGKGPICGGKEGEEGRVNDGELRAANVGNIGDLWDGGEKGFQ